MPERVSPGAAIRVAHAMHPGRFNAHYRQRFGEDPRDTFGAPAPCD